MTLEEPAPFDVLESGWAFTTHLNKLDNTMARKILIVDDDQPAQDLPREEPVRGAAFA
jgi:hypothetical protein